MTDANPASILDSVKKVLGFDPDYTAFDLDITMHINSAFGELQQIGVGGDTGFAIADNTTLWSQYVSSLTYLGMIQQFIYLSVRMAFDTPATSFAIAAIEKQIEQLSFRINIAAEHIDPPSDPFATTTITVEGSSNTYFVVKTVQLGFASVVTMDASAGNTFYLTMTGNCTIEAPVLGTDGEHITLELISNGHTVTWGPGWNFGDNGEPSLSTGGLVDVISGVWRAADNEWLTGFTPGF
jgi:hypothetical protein